MNRRWNGIIAVCLVLVVICSVLTLGIGEEQPKDAVLPAGKAVNPTVRVLLSRLSLTDRLDVSLTAPYGVCFGSHEMYVDEGSQLAFILRSGMLYLYMDGLSMRLGEQVELKRYAGAEAERTGFYRTGFDPLYLGDLRLTVEEGKLVPVLSIHVEDYLLGVVPHEMSDSFPVEALKAQTIAARTYVLRRANPSQAYDVVDTTNDQVFRGYLPGSPNSEQAIAETRGICGFYRDELAQCYYSASNGGQTELVQTVWPTREDYGYYAFGRDPYDVENPASTVRTVRFEKEYNDDETAPYGLRKMLGEQLTGTLQELGYDDAPESILVHKVSSVSVDTPSAKDSLHMTMLHLTVEISGRTKTQAPAAVLLAMPEDEEVYLFVTPAATTPAPLVQATPEAAAPTPTPQPVYGPFERLGEPVELSVPIFGAVENALAMNISTNYDNEIWSVVEDDTGYTLEARRYGHGVGMSQRGAEQMAKVYEKDFREILAFYYPGMELRRFDVGEPQLLKPEEALSATAGPAPTVTPRPTLMPVTKPAAPGQWYAVVTEIADDSSLNLRSRPDLSGDILMRLYKNQRLLVLERCPEEGWVHVETDSVTGYVMESFLTAE